MQFVEIADNDGVSNVEHDSDAETKPDHHERVANDDRWLPIDAACKIIGVDQSTLRRWSDDGKISVYRTPGGHRRYREGQLRAFLRGESTLRQQINQASLLKLSYAEFDSQVREIEGRQNEGEIAIALRDIGRQMLEPAVFCICAQGDREAFLAQGRILGRRFGRLAGQSKLSARQTIEALLSLRRPLLNAVKRDIGQRHLLQSECSRIFDELNHFMDETLLATIQAYEMIEH